MDHTPAVYVVEPLQNCHHHFYNDLEGYPLAPLLCQVDKLSQGVPFDVLHAEKETISLVSKIENFHQVRMGDPCEGPGFIDESFPEEPLLSQVTGEKLHRNPPLETMAAQDLGEKDLPHASLANELDEPVLIRDDFHLPCSGQSRGT